MGIGDKAYNIKWFFERLLEKPYALLQKWLKSSFVRKVILVAASVLVITTVTILCTVAAAKNANKKADAILTEWKIDPIADEDIFVQEEPNFLPPVIFQQKQKSFWTEADAAKYWYNPAEYPKEIWKDRIGVSIDKLLENVP